MVGATVEATDGKAAAPSKAPLTAAPSRLKPKLTAKPDLSPAPMARTAGILEAVADGAALGGLQLRRATPPSPATSR